MLSMVQLYKGLWLRSERGSLRLEGSILLSCIDTVAELVFVRCTPANNVHSSILFAPFDQAAGTTFKYTIS